MRVYETKIKGVGFQNRNRQGGVTIYKPIQWGIQHYFNPTARGYLCCSTIKQTFDPQSFQQTYQN